jgi:uncharacterized membrane protein
MDDRQPLQLASRKISNLILIITGLLVFSIWLVFTPPSLDGKLHAAGYAVCHQLESHSRSFAGKVLPLCARCTGTFLGVLISLIYLSSNRKNGGIPSRLKIALLVLFFTAFAIDGINSSLTILPGVTPLYPPDNRLRLFTGLLFGICLGNLVLPLWNQTLWAKWENEPVLKSWRQFILLIFLVAAIGFLIQLEIPFLYYPIAFFSIVAIFIILGMIYSLLWCIILKKENSLHHFRDGTRIFIIGMITAILQVGMMDFARYVITKTW